MLQPSSAANITYTSAFLKDSHMSLNTMSLNTCSACGAPIRMPAVGEVWSNTHSGYEYTVTHEPREGGNWWGGTICGPGDKTNAGFFPGIEVAIWYSAVREGHWRFVR